MRPGSLLLLICVLLEDARHSTAAPFQNLDFEQANTNNVAFDPQLGAWVGPIGDLLPGWRVTVSFPPVPPVNLGSTNSLSVIPMNSYIFSTEGDDVVLTTGDPVQGVVPPKTGNYSLFLSAGFPNTTITLSQTAEVPPEATELVLNGALGLATSIGGPFSVSLGGVPLHTDGQLHFDGPHYLLSGFAGETEALAIELNGWQLRLDSLSFVPEPSTLTLCTLGCALAYWQIRPSRRTRSEGLTLNLESSRSPRKPAKSRPRV
jgi:hypothetical protein